MTAQRRILTLSPMPPEPLAYGLARYSRSADGIEDSLRWIAARENASEKFLTSYYYAYGHGSIADLASVVSCVEHCSELAAILLEDEPLWNGQAKSTRYQRLSRESCFRPDALQATPTLAAQYEDALTTLFHAYDTLHPKLVAYLSAKYPRPATMTEEAYARTVNARAFDSVRYFLPLATLTNVGQLLTIRTLEKQITRLGAHPLPEVQEIAQELRQRCAEPPTAVWDDLMGHTPSRAPLAPTLARYCDPNPYPQQSADELKQCAASYLNGLAPETHQTVQLIPVHDPLHELTTTLLYPVTTLSYQQILQEVQAWPEARCREVIALATKHRGPHHELLNEFQIGHGFTFDVLMDIGGWRDLHRHRRWFQTRQAFTTDYGIARPPLLAEAGLMDDYTHTLWAVGGSLRTFQQQALAAGLPDFSTYLVPFGYRCRSLYKGSLSQLSYVIALRSGVKGHPSYRQVAWEMYQALTQAHPFTASILTVTPPDVEDPLVR